MQGHVSDSILRGEAPIASHILFTQPGILDDSKPEERKLGMGAGHAWIRHAELMAVYTDRGISHGMLVGMETAQVNHCPIEKRIIPGYVNPDHNETYPEAAQFKPGQFWKTRNGGVVQIESIFEKKEFPYIVAAWIKDEAANSHPGHIVTFCPDGKYLLEGESQMDLVEEVGQPA